MDQACPEQVELCSPVALAFDQLQAADLPFDLSAAPWKRQGCTHGLLVLMQAGGKAAQVAVSGLGQPRGELIRGARANQDTEVLGKVAEPWPALAIATVAARHRRGPALQETASQP